MKRPVDMSDEDWDKKLEKRKAIAEARMDEHDGTAAPLLICTKANMPPFRQCWYYPIMMPTNADGVGPVPVWEAVGVHFEVWDQMTTTSESFEYLPDAIEHAIQKNLGLPLRTINGELWVVPD